VIDDSCPCTVFNPISVLNVMPFGNLGWGSHMRVHVYDIMNPDYVPPTHFNDFKPIQLPDYQSESEEFHMKVVN
jgi:hypothetical protein